MHATAGNGVEIHRQRRHQRLAFSGAHFGDLAVMQHHAANQLHIEMAHAQRAPAAFAHHGKGLGQQLVERLAGLKTLLELLGPAPQRFIGERLHGWLQRIDAHDRLGILLHQTLIAAAENFLDYSG
ncbi:hypothetical protein GALL_423150 [mine drainage metagenome]|uniref:Uncharacterized protein n=1 Tax=mine drainage metagenome TaxID=410659 RepID=A0A1J5QER9_9ZZZZ